MPSPNVYVVDDDADVRTALARLLHSAGLDPATFDSPQAFLGHYDSDEPACLVLDLAMPGIDGLDLQRMLEARAPSLQIVFLTGHGDIAAGVQAMKRGAVDFLTKPVDDETLLAAIAQALARARALHDTQAERRNHQQRLGLLTAREKEVLDGVVAGKLNKQIAFDLGTVEKTIKFHRGNLMRKLQVRTIADLVKFAERAGVGKRGGS
jgi:FixJ family two-component response regulator